jgi:hypothetical protein
LKFAAFDPSYVSTTDHPQSDIAQYDGRGDMNPANFDMALSPARAHKNFFDSCPIEEHAPMSSDPSALLEPGYSHNGLNYETYSQRTPNPSLENQALAHSAQSTHPSTSSHQI